MLRTCQAGNIRLKRRAIRAIVNFTQFGCRARHRVRGSDGRARMQAQACEAAERRLLDSQSARLWDPADPADPDLLRTYLGLRLT